MIPDIYTLNDLAKLSASIKKSNQPQTPRELSTTSGPYAFPAFPKVPDLREIQLLKPNRRLKPEKRALIQPVEPALPRTAKGYNKSYLYRYSQYLQQLKEHEQAVKDFKEGRGTIWKQYREDTAIAAERYLRNQQKIQDRFAADKSKQIGRQLKQDEAAYRKKRKAQLQKAFGGGDFIYAGYAPWDSRYGTFKRLNKKQLESMGANYGQIKNPTKKTIHLADGTTAEVIDSHLGVPLGFSQQYGYRGASDTVIDDKGMSSQDYADRAFDGKHKTHNADGCGHIKHLEYSAYFQLLKVTFWNDQVCIYYRVPSTVAGELLHFAETKQESTNTFDGKQRHVLGIRFWDLIRIRGTKHGARYRFEYGSGSAPYVPTGGHGGGVKGEELNPVMPYDEFMKLKDQIGFDNTSITPRGDSTGMSREDYTLNREGFDKDLVSALKKRGAEQDKLRQQANAKAQQTEAIDKYFDTRYNKDLTNTSLKRNLLHIAYDMYSSKQDSQDVYKILTRAGVKL